MLVLRLFPANSRLLVLRSTSSKILTHKFSHQQLVPTVSFSDLAAPAALLRLTLKELPRTIPAK